MFGSGVLKGLGVTLKEFVDTYIDDIKKIPSRYAGGKKEIDQTDVSAQTGLFTIQYPEERRKLAERLRYIPMLIYDADTGEDRCTACGICAKVCPPQCIWIVRAKDENGKPLTRPLEFNIDISICMNCGLCAEFCPFDSIKMNNDYEIAAYQRMPHLVFDLQKLRVPTTYYASIRPTDWEAEETARKAKEAEKAAKPAPAPKVGAGASPAPLASAPPAPAPATAVSTPAAPATSARTPEEIERLKAEAAARRAAKAAGEAAGTLAPVAEAPAVAAPAPAGVGAQRTPEEIARLKAEAAARRAAKTAGETVETVAAAPAPEPPAPAAPAAEPAPAGVGAQRTPEEIARLKAEAAARRAAKTAGETVETVAAAPAPEPPAPAAPAAEPAPSGVGAQRTPEEIARLKAEAAARRAAKAAQGPGDQK